MQARRMYSHAVIRDAGIVALSIVVAVLIAEGGIIERLLETVGGFGVLGSVLAGVFFTSVFTTAPATVAFAKLGQSLPLFQVAFLGGMGAVAGDFLMFLFIRDHLLEDISHLLGSRGWHRWKAISERRLFRWLLPFLGAIAIASPLPDEIGIALMGVAKMRKSFFVPFSFALNTVGILVIGLVGRGLA